jgi:acetyl esterase
MEPSGEVLENIAFSEKMGFDKLDQLSPAETREKMKQFPKNPDPLPVAKVINHIIPEGNILVRIYIPKGAGPFPVVSYFHGGGFVLMSIDLVDDICRAICTKSESVVMSVDYLLAPEHPFPAGPNSCIMATKWMIQNAGKYKGIGEQMLVGGDSAGGYMSLYTAQKLTHEGIKLMATFAAYPVTDHYSSHHPSWEENKQGYILTAQIMKWFWDNYLSNPSQIDAASPLRAKDFSGLPPTLIITADFDPLRDEGKAYAENLKQANVETIYRNYENIHGFLGTGKMGQDAIQLICDFLKEQIKNKKEPGSKYLSVHS